MQEHCFWNLESGGGVLFCVWKKLQLMQLTISGSVAMIEMRKSGKIRKETCRSGLYGRERYWRAASPL